MIHPSQLVASLKDFDSQSDSEPFKKKIKKEKKKKIGKSGTIKEESAWACASPKRGAIPHEAGHLRRAPGVEFSLSFSRSLWSWEKPETRENFRIRDFPVAQPGACCLLQQLNLYSVRGCLGVQHTTSRRRDAARREQRLLVR